MQRVIAGPALREEAIRATREQYFTVKKGRAGFAKIAGRTEGPSYTTRGEWLEEQQRRLTQLEQLNEHMLREGR